MNVHEHARMTQRGRVLLVQRIRDGGWKVADAAQAAGVSTRTAYKWLARFRAGGERMLHDRSSAPVRKPRATPPVAVATVEAVREARHAARRRGGVTSGGFAMRVLHGAHELLCTAQVQAVSV